MMRSKLDEQLNLLNTELIKMGSMCESNIAMITSALLDADMEMARKVLLSDTEMNEKEREIENLCMKLLLQQQPVARDLRYISSALKMITDMERIGDQACDIAEIITMQNIKDFDETNHIDQMAYATIKMVTESIDAFVQGDIELAKEIIAYDDVVDGLFNEVKAALVKRFNKTEDLEHALDLLMIAKYFERIGDHATNIAEWVLYSITGSKEGYV